MQMAALEPCDGSLTLGLGRHDSEWRYQVLLGYGRYCVQQPSIPNSPTHLGNLLDRSLAWEMCQKETQACDVMVTKDADCLLRLDA